jgi:hypothetical protein
MYIENDWQGGGEVGCKLLLGYTKLVHSSPAVLIDPLCAMSAASRRKTPTQNAKVLIGDIEGKATCRLHRNLADD